MVDELAHANLPGELHPGKCWQDVEDRLASGIDVYTTSSTVANIESLSQAVGKITGVHPAEPGRMRSCGSARSSSSTFPRCA